jgi:long-chain acyl-CoA synthetase
VRGSLPELEHVIVLAGEAEGAMTLAELRSRGAAEGASIAHERVGAVNPDDAATIVYTSGTTGPPKGCVLSHANLLFTCDAYIDRLRLREAPPVIFTYLPLAHVLARMVSFVALDTAACSRSRAATRRTSPRTSRAASRPHPDRAAPAGEDPHARDRPAAAAAAPRRRSSRARWRPARRSPRPSARAASSPFDRARHASATGWRCRRCATRSGPNDPVLITGAAPIGAEVIEFFYACGVPVLEGYGMTETCAAATLNTLDEVQVGSVGRPLPGTEVRSATTARS